VLSNFLSNAIKFTDEGSTINITIRRDGDDLHMAVADEGIGISEEAIKRIFDPFEQAEVSTTRKYGGSGLGLSIAKQLIKLLQGELSVQSKLGEGSTFSFFIHGPEVIPHETGTKQTDTHTLNGHVLVAEDNKTNQMLVSILLEEMGLSFSIVEDGRQAVQALESNPQYDLVLMDINMPNMNGIEATLAIRDTKNSYHDIPIIALTANAMKEDVASYFEAGFNDHVPKPIDSEHLYTIISNYLSPTGPKQR
jgi:CheY-like chemotaxis protein